MSVEFIEIDFKEIEEKNLQEERKTNGRFAAIVVAAMIIILAIYHAWIRRIAVLAGILVPALIMILYGIWVIFLTKRYKQRRLLFARQMEEIARKEYAAIRLAKLNKINSKHLLDGSPLQGQKNDRVNDSHKINMESNLSSATGSVEGSVNSVKSKHHTHKHKKKKIKRPRRPSIHNYNKTGENNLSNKRLSFRLKLLKLNHSKALETESNNEESKVSPQLVRTKSAPC